MSQRASVARNTAYSSIGIYTEYVLGLLTSIAIARHLGPADLGIYSLVIWLSAVGVALTNSGISTAMIKFVAELRGSARPQLIAALVRHARRIQRWFFLGVLALGLTALLLLRERLPSGLEQYQLVLLIVTIGLRAPYMLNISLAKGFEDFRATALVALLAAPTNLGLVLGAVLLDASITTFLEVFAVSSLVFYIASVLMTRKLVDRSSATALPAEIAARLHRHVRYVAVTVSISFVAASEVEVLFLNLLASSESAGTFKVAYTLASGAALLLPGVFSAILLPMMASAVGQGGDLAARRLSAVLRYLTLLSAPLAAFGLGFGPQIIGLLYGRDYVQAGPVLAVLLASACYGAIAGGANSLLVSFDRQPTVLGITIAFALLKCSAALMAIPSHGLWGAVWAGVGASLLASTATIWLAVRLSRARPEWRSIAGAVLAAAFAGTLAAVLGALLPPLPALVCGAIVFAPVYGAMTVLLRAWSQADLAQFARVHQRWTGSRPAALARVLRWASERAGADR